MPRYIDIFDKDIDREKLQLETKLTSTRARARGCHGPRCNLDISAGQMLPDLGVILGRRTVRARARTRSGDLLGKTCAREARNCVTTTRARDIAEQYAREVVLGE